MTPNSVKSLFLIINKINGYIKERNVFKKKIEELIRLIKANSDDQKYIEIKFNSNNDLSWKK